MSNDWTKALQEALSNSADKVPEGFKTRAQIKQETGYSESGVKKLVKRLEELKAVEIEHYRVYVSGQLRMLPHYRGKDQGSSAAR